MPGPSAKSRVWQYFINLDPKNARCKLCATPTDPDSGLVNRSGGTGKLWSHLKGQHRSIHDKLNGLGLEENEAVVVGSSDDEEENMLPARKRTHLDSVPQSPSASSSSSLGTDSAQETTATLPPARTPDSNRRRDGPLDLFLTPSTLSQVSF